MSFNWVLQMVTTIAVGIIAFFFKTMAAEFKAGLASNSQDVKQVRQELNDLKSDLPLIYVTREDFIRAMNSSDKNFNKMDEKLDKIYDRLSERGN